MTFKLKFQKLGGHVHVAVFSGKDIDHLGKCGDLTMREEEWPEFLGVFQNATYPPAIFVEERTIEETVNEKVAEVVSYLKTLKVRS